jgi:hypothetical protein
MRGCDGLNRTAARLRSNGDDEDGGDGNDDGEEMTQ